jgi:hypothetical protein
MPKIDFYDYKIKMEKRDVISNSLFAPNMEYKDTGNGFYESSYNGEIVVFSHIKIYNSYCFAYGSDSNWILYKTDGTIENGKIKFNINTLGSSEITEEYIALRPL